MAEWCKADAHSPSACCAYDPCHLLQEGSGGPTEIAFAHTLQRHFIEQHAWEPRFVIDTGRNGAPDTRQSCASWCNVRGAGAGHIASTNTEVRATHLALHTAR